MAGLGIAWLAVRAFISAVPTTEPPFWVDFGMDRTVVGFVLAVTFVSILISGLLPAIRASLDPGTARHPCRSARGDPDRLTGREARPGSPAPMARVMCT